MQGARLSIGASPFCILASLQKGLYMDIAILLAAILLGLALLGIVFPPVTLFALVLALVIGSVAVVKIAIIALDTGYQSKLTNEASGKSGRVIPPHETPLPRPDATRGRSMRSDKDIDDDFPYFLIG